MIDTVFFIVTLGYYSSIIIFDYRKHGRFVVSRNYSRHLLDGVTFATGITVSFALINPALFNVVANNTLFITVTASVCMLGPLVNLADRYERTVD
jgi:hypothetical protein